MLLLDQAPMLNVRITTVVIATPQIQPSNSSSQTCRNWRLATDVAVLLHLLSS